MLKLKRRHNPKRCKASSGTDKRCVCPIWVSGWLNGKRIPRRALKTRMMGEAEREVEKWQRGGIDTPQTTPQAAVVAAVPDLTVAAAIEKYLANCTAEKNNQPSTLVSYRNTLKLFGAYLSGQEIVSLKDLTIEHVRGYLETRIQFTPKTRRKELEPARLITPRTRRKELEHIRFFINYCMDTYEWFKKVRLKKVRVKVPKGGATMPLTDEEIEALITACDEIDNPNQKYVQRARLRSKALILTMCYTGFRISDVVSLRRDQVALDGAINDHVMVKTKSLVFTELGERALRALFALPVESEYFLWSGPKQSKLSTATGSARRTLYSLKRATGISVHPHRFRDTFAKKILEETGDIRILQHLLGHNSLKTTEEAYQHLGPKHKARLSDALATIKYETTTQPVQ